MRYPLLRSCLILLFLDLALLPGFAQQPAATPKQIAIQNVTMESAALPGSNRPWIKVVTNFQSSVRWADGIAFSYTVLLSAGDQHRVLPGVVRYANVKGGANRAVMYISPNTVERFGAPVGAHVKAFYKDEVADDFVMKPSGNVPSGWENQYDKYPGLLMTVINTPWIITDYASSPDIFATQ